MQNIHAALIIKSGAIVTQNEAEDLIVLAQSKPNEAKKKLEEAKKNSASKIADPCQEYPDSKECLCKDIDSSEDYNQARNKALKWLEENGGFSAEEVNLSRLEHNKGVPYGMQTKKGKAGFRVEYDEKYGAHINAWHGKKKSKHFTFKAKKKTVNKINKKFECKE